MVDGSVGQGVSLSVRDQVQAFHGNNPPWFTPCSLTSSLNPSWSRRPISLSRAVWQYACSFVLVSTMKNCVFIPKFFPSHCSFCLDFLLLPAPLWFFSFPSFWLRHPVPEKGYFASALWAPLVFGTLLSPAYFLPPTQKQAPCPEKVATPGSVRVPMVDMKRAGWVRLGYVSFCLVQIFLVAWSWLSWLWLCLII